MMSKYALPLLAIIGLVFAIGAVIQGNETPAITLPPVQAAKVPFASYVAGAGIIEASTENIAIGTPVAGIVTAIYVKWSDRVNTGDPLFKIDDRDMQGQLLLATAKVKEAEANLAKANYLLKLGEGLSVGSSISALDKENRRFDVAIKEAGLASATAQVEQIKIEIERRTIRAPVTGRILQIKTRLGEFAQSGALTTPLMLLGDDSRLHLRVDIDENDAWRVQSGANATAFVRSNPMLETPLKFERFEPYVIPKASLTGQSTERTDTRVLQVIYSFDRAALPVYVGQQMDAFIEAPLLPGQTLQRNIHRGIFPTTARENLQTSRQARGDSRCSA
ncbi:MAG: family efflux transporter, subunit [Bradyrhizobium sp.]|jgi:RND family efflux transporter MFP subunit|nr:family efflux transporter, subunit [Bradyrhizobium sp.]